MYVYIYIIYIYIYMTMCIYILCGFLKVKKSNPKNCGCVFCCGSKLHLDREWSGHLDLGLWYHLADFFEVSIHHVRSSRIWSNHVQWVLVNSHSDVSPPCIFLHLLGKTLLFNTPNEQKTATSHGFPSPSSPVLLLSRRRGFLGTTALHGHGVMAPGTLRHGHPGWAPHRWALWKLGSLRNACLGWNKKLLCKCWLWKNIISFQWKWNFWQYIYI